MKKILALFAFICILSITVHAQRYYGPTYRNDFVNYSFMGGYQYLSHSSGDYNVATIHAEALFSFFGSRIGLTVGPDYLSFSPCGIFLFAPRIFIQTIRGEGGNPALLPFLLLAISAAQWHIPLSDQLEISFGWDALKFTKLKNYSDSYYISGSLNAGLMYFLGDNFFVSGYYEFNHTHNPMIAAINWAFGGGTFSDQPSVLQGHSFGVRIGWMF